METQQTEFETIKERIAKLLRKADSATELNSMAEATAFTNKATELLMKYNIELRDINLKAGLPVEPEIEMEIFRESELYPIKKTDSNGWIVRILNTIATNNLCKIVTMGDISKDMKFRIFGTADNIMNVISTTKIMCRVSNNLASQSWSEYTGVELKKNKFKRDFMQGFPLGLHNGYKEREINPDEFALVKTNSIVIDDKISRVVGKLVNGKRRAINVNEAYNKGVIAGKTVELDKFIS